MATRPALFRVLLAALLLLNVVGTAAAGAMHAAGAHDAVLLQQVAGEVACHGDDVGGMDHEAPSAPAPDCCGDGACTTCASFAHAMAPHIPALTTAWAARAAPSKHAPGYANAALQRLVRPPIG